MPLIHILGPEIGGVPDFSQYNAFRDPVQSLDGTNDRIIWEFFDKTSHYRFANGYVRRQTHPDINNITFFVAGKDQMTTYGTWQSHVDSLTNLVTNGGFADGSSWTPTGGASIGSGIATFASDGTLTQTLPTLGLGWYLVEFDLPTVTSGTITVSLGGTSSDTRAVTTDGAGSWGVWLDLRSSVSGSDLVFTAASTGVFTLDNVSVKKADGNHFEPASTTNTAQLCKALSVSGPNYNIEFTSDTMYASDVNLGDDFHVCMAYSACFGANETLYDMLWSYRPVREVGVGVPASTGNYVNFGHITGGNTVEHTFTGPTMTGACIVETFVDKTNGTMSSWVNSELEVLADAATLNHSGSARFAIACDGSASGSDELSNLRVEAVYAYGNQRGRRDELPDFINRQVGGLYNIPISNYSFNPIEDLAGSDNVICDFFDITSMTANDKDTLGVKPDAAGDTVGLVINKAGFQRRWQVCDDQLDEYNVVVNGTFDADTDWSKGTGVTIGSGVASFDGTTASTTLTQTSTFAGADDYLIEFEVTAYTAGTVTVSCSGGGTTAAYTPSVGVHNVVMNVTGAGNLVFTSGAAASELNASIDNVKVIPLGTTKHFEQATAADRPTIRQERGGAFFLQFDGTNDDMVLADMDCSDSIVNIFAMPTVSSEIDDATLLCIDTASTDVEFQNSAAAVWTPHVTVNNTQVTALESVVEIQPHSWDFQLDSTANEMTVWRDGQLIADAVSATMTFAGTDDIIIGNDSAGTGFLDCRVWGFYKYADSGGRNEWLKAHVVNRAKTAAGWFPSWEGRSYRAYSYNFNDPTGMWNDINGGGGQNETFANRIGTGDGVGWIADLTRLKYLDKWGRVAEWIEHEAYEMIPDPTLTDQSWVTSYGTGVSQSGSTIVCTGAAGSFTTLVFADFSTEMNDLEGDIVECAIMEVELSSYTSGGMRIWWGGASGSTSDVITPTGAGTYTWVVALQTDGTNDGVYLQSSATDLVATISRISVKSIPGWYLRQPVSTDRPLFQRDSNNIGYLDFDGVNDELDTGSSSKFQRNALGVCFDPGSTTQALRSSVFTWGSTSYEDIRIGQSVAQDGSNWQSAISIDTVGAVTEVWTATGTDDGIQTVEIVTDANDNDFDVYFNGDIDTAGTAQTFNLNATNQAHTAWVGASNGALEYDGAIYGLYFLQQNSGEHDGRLRDWLRIRGGLDIV